jgi:hypothetical protein
MSQAREGFGFAPEEDAPIAYMQRIRDYYLALGYKTPYRWAHYAEVPFQPLLKPLASNPRPARSSVLTNVSITRTGFFSSTQSSAHSGNNVICPRSTPSTNRFIQFPSNPNRITSCEDFHTARVKLRKTGSAEALPVTSNSGNFIDGSGQPVSANSRHLANLL